MVDWRQQFESNPQIYSGQLCARGTRIPITVILDSVAEGSTREEILKSYPSLLAEHIDAALAYAAELADCCTSIGIIERGQLLMHGPIDDVYRRIRGNRTVEVRFMNGMDVGLSVIRSSPHVRNVAVDVNSCVVELEANDDQVNDLLQQLVYNKCGVRSFSEKDPSLEDVFMMVTKGLVT